MHESGNAMKDLLGIGENLKWDINEN